MVEQTSNANASRASTVQQLVTLAGFIAGVLAGLSFEALQYWVKHKTELREKLLEVFEIPVDTYAEARADWAEFYSAHFGVTADFRSVVIPEKPQLGLWRLIFIPKGLTMNATLAVMRRVFAKVLVYIEDLDASVTTNTRTSAGNYAVWVRDGVEPDAEYLGKSTREADMAGTIGMTLLERLVAGVKLFVEEKKHLDVKGITLCTGSRDADGDVPGVCFCPADDTVYVDWCRVDSSSAAGGLRQAVS